METPSRTHVHSHMYKYLIKPNGKSSSGNFITGDLPDTPSSAHQVRLSHFMMHGRHLHSRAVAEAVGLDTSSDRSSSISQPLPLREGWGGGAFLVSVSHK